MRRRAVLVAALGAVLAASQAQAQLVMVPPRILIIFDTSGSMAWRLDSNEPCGGDGSDDFPSNQPCRIFAAKQALRNVLLAIGEDEAEFSLMRYAQLEGRNAQRFPEQYPRPINYRGTCDGGGDVLARFEHDNLAQIDAWIDQEETFPENRELRADGPTPLAGSLGAARDYLLGDVFPADPFADCRIYAVILLTDGVDTCPGNACATIGELTRLPVPAGGVAEVRTYVIGFGPLGGVQERDLDRLAACANPDGGVVGAFRASDQAALQLAFGHVIGLSLPIEICDGRDNDCDGLIDEDVLNQCGACGPDPVEICNGRDDDCDNEIDEGVRNSCGACGPEPVELCNNIDDDCDGQVDEGDACQPPGCIYHEETCDNRDNDCDTETDEGVTRPCGLDTGECQPGHQACQEGFWLEECQDEIGPTDELCDGKDNDCDGYIDGQTQRCGEGLGKCGDGRQICVNGDWGQCQGAGTPTPEECNGIDDDCDGVADEGVRNLCGECGPDPEEICNSFDDDCDGRTDDDARCPEGFACVYGECTKPCFYGECPLGQLCVADVCLADPCRLARCPAGSVCNSETGECGDPCAGISCDGGQACRMGQCVEPDCRDTGCDPGQVCRAGACEDHPCRNAGCGALEYCRDGACIPSCEGVSCPRGEVCLDGQCEPRGCVAALCPPGQTCVVGACAQDPCGGVACPSGTQCIEGECADPPCAFVVCPQEHFCELGVCKPPGQATEVDAGDVGDAGGTSPDSARDAAADDDVPGGETDAPPPEGCCRVAPPGERERVPSAFLPLLRR